MRAVGLWLWLVLGCGRIGFEVCAGCDGNADKIQRVHATSVGSTLTQSTTIAIDAQPGDTVIAIVYEHTDDASVTDSLGTAWTPLAAEMNVCNNTFLRLWYAHLPGGADTITLSIASHPDPMGGIVVEYSGVDPVVPIDTSDGALASTPDTVAHAGTLIAGDGDMIVAAFADAMSLGSMGIAAGYREIGRDDLFSMIAEDMPVSAGSYSPTATLPAGMSDSCALGASLALRPK